MSNKKKENLDAKNLVFGKLITPINIDRKIPCPSGSTYLIGLFKQ